MNDLPFNPSSTGGFNPMRWKCEGGGNCYLEKHHLRKENFFDCFPGKIAVSDIDFVVEVSGRIMFAEWKPPGGTMTDGQDYLLHSLGRCRDAEGRPFVVVAVYGDPVSLEIKRVVRYRDGKVSDAHAQDLPEFRRRLIGFSNRARGHVK